MEELLQNLTVIFATLGGIALVLSKAIKDISKVIQENKSAEQMPDQSYEVPDQGVGMPDEHGSEELKIRNQLLDEKVERLKEELAQSARPGEIYEEDHSVIDEMYIPKPTHEYAD